MIDGRKWFLKTSYGGYNVRLFCDKIVSAWSISILKIHLLTCNLPVQLNIVFCFQWLWQFQINEDIFWLCSIVWVTIAGLFLVWLQQSWLSDYFVISSHILISSQLLFGIFRVFVFVIHEEHCAWDAERYEAIT